MSLVPIRRENETLMDRLLNRDQSLIHRFNRDFGRDFDLIGPHMSKMDEEMKRFATDMDTFRKSNMYSLVPGGSKRANDLVSLQDPAHIVDENGSKKFQVRMDVSKFKPEEIEVKAKDNSLMVHAKHCDETGGSKSYSEYKQQYLLPPSVDPVALASKLSDDGILTIEAPVNPALTQAAPKLAVRN